MHIPTAVILAVTLLGHLTTALVTRDTIRNLTGVVDECRARIGGEGEVVDGEWVLVGKEAKNRDLEGKRDEVEAVSFSSSFSFSSLVLHSDQLCVCVRGVFDGDLSRYALSLDPSGFNVWVWVR